MSGMSPTVEPFFEGWLMTRTRFVHTWKLRHVRLFCSTDSKNAIEISQAESGCNTETLALDCITSISTVEASVFDRPHCFSIAYCEKHRWFKHKQVLGFQARDDAQRSAWVSKLQQASQSVKPDGEEQDTRDLGGSEWVNAPKSSIAAGIKQILPHLRSMQSAVVATPKLNTDSVTWDTLSNISTTASGTFTLLEETAIQFEDVGVDSKKGSGEPGMKEQDPQGCVVTPCEKPLPFGDRLPLSDAGDLSSEDGSVFDNLFEERSSDEVKEDIATLEWVFQQEPVQNKQRPMAKSASTMGPLQWARKVVNRPTTSPEEHNLVPPPCAPKPAWLYLRKHAVNVVQLKIWAEILCPGLLCYSGVTEEAGDSASLGEHYIAVAGADITMCKPCTSLQSNGRAIEIRAPATQVGTVRYWINADDDSVLEEWYRGLKAMSTAPGTGYLCVRNGAGVWRRQWMVLQGDVGQNKSCALLCYRSPGEYLRQESPKKCFPITKQTELIRFRGGKKFQFIITAAICEGTAASVSNTEHGLRLCASTQDEFQRWIQAINKRLKSNRRSNFLHDFTHHMSNPFSTKSPSSTTVPSTSSSERVPLKSGIARKLGSWQTFYQRSPVSGAE